uniref:Uncharacterized protein n=1 Tax=Anguilla anguilla TaxID=7936 RepID=A0A0E9TGC8_ANGAN
MPEEDPNKPAGTGRDKPTACQLQLITTISNTFSTSNNSKKVNFLSGKSNSNCKPNLLKKKDLSKNSVKKLLVLTVLVLLK